MLNLLLILVLLSLYKDWLEVDLIFILRHSLCSLIEVENDSLGAIGSL